MNTKRILIFFLIILLLSIFSVIYPTLTGNITKQDYYPKENAILLRAVDGDTIEANVSGEIWKIRLLGINTPEKNQPFYSEAKAFLQKFENKSIELQRDKDDTDMYKRKLRYLFYNDNLLEIEILEQGLANSYYFSGLMYEKELLEAEKNARSNERGIWTKSNEECADCIILSELNATAESFRIKNICNFNCDLNGWFVKDAGRNRISLENLGAESEQKYLSKKEIWNNDHDMFFMFDEEGFLVIYYAY